MTELLTVFLFHEGFDFGVVTCFYVGFVNKLKQKENEKVHVRIFLDDQVDKLVLLFYFERNHVPADHAGSHFGLQIDKVLH